MLSCLALAIAARSLWTRADDDCTGDCPWLLVAVPATAIAASKRVVTPLGWNGLVISIVWDGGGEKARRRVQRQR